MFQVCSNVTQCYRVASQFEKCREMLQEMPAVIKELCRILYYKVSWNLKFFTYIFSLSFQNVVLSADAYCIIMIKCVFQHHPVMILIHFLLQHLTKLCSVVAETVTAFSIDPCLQTALYQSGVLWHLMLFFFNYDYTLAEGGVSTQEVIMYIYFSLLSLFTQPESLLIIHHPLSNRRVISSILLTAWHVTLS